MLVDFSQRFGQAFNCVQVSAGDPKDHLRHQCYREFQSSDSQSDQNKERLSFRRRSHENSVSYIISLPGQSGCSVNTVCSYRDTFSLFWSDVTFRCRIP